MSKVTRFCNFRYDLFNQEHIRYANKYVPNTAKCLVLVGFYDKNSQVRLD